MLSLGLLGTPHWFLLTSDIFQSKGLTTLDTQAKFHTMVSGDWDGGGSDSSRGGPAADSSLAGPTQAEMRAILLIPCPLKSQSPKERIILRVHCHLTSAIQLHYLCSSLICREQETELKASNQPSQLQQKGGQKPWLPALGLLPYLGVIRDGALTSSCPQGT